MPDQTTLVALAAGAVGGILGKWLQAWARRRWRRFQDWRDARAYARDPRGHYDKSQGEGAYDEMLARRAWMEAGRKGPPPIAAARAAARP